jgi:fluoride exporter
VAFSILAISVGASFGALLRWLFTTQLNGWFPSLPMGTLTANLLGGYLVGIAVATLAQHPALPPQWRLFIVTGFLGGLTTFSTFSAEVVGHLMEGRIGWGVSVVAAHVIGSVAMTLLGIGTVALLR